MQMKTIVFLSMLSALCISTYLLIIEYYNEYAPENLIIHKLLDKKYRCIRFFHDKVIDKYAYISCKMYHTDYIDFLLEKSRYVYLFYAHNVIIISLTIIIYLLL